MSEIDSCAVDTLNRQDLNRAIATLLLGSVASEDYPHSQLMQTYG